MKAIRPITEEDKSWMEPIFKKYKYILGTIGMPWYWFWKDQNPKEKWDCIEGVGFVHYYCKNNGRKTIRNIAVDEQYKGQGIAQKLVEHVGAPIDLKTDKDNVESNRFYEKLGFKLVGEKETRGKNKKTMNLWALD